MEKRKKTFFTVNTKIITAHVLKFILYSPQKSKYSLYINPHLQRGVTHDATGFVWVNQNKHNVLEFNSEFYDTHCHCSTQDASGPSSSKHR